MDPAPIIADLLATSLMPSEGWSSARATYIWEHNALCYLEQRKKAGDRPPINAWTAMLVEEGYPAAKAGEAKGKYWRPGMQPRPE